MFLPFCSDCASSTGGYARAIMLHVMGSIPLNRPFFMIISLFFFLIFSRLTVRVRRLGFGLVWVYFIYFITQENLRIVLVTRCSDGSEITSCHFEASEITSSYPQMSIRLSHAMRPGLQIRHFWVAKSLFLTITFNQKKQDKTFCF